MATPQVKDLVLRSPAGAPEVLTFSWPLQVGSGQDRHDNGIDIIETIKYVGNEVDAISSAFEELDLTQIDTACYKTMTNLVDRFNKAVDSIVALEKGTSLPAERLNKFAQPTLLKHILQLVYNAAVLEPDKLNNYEPFSPEVYGETSYDFVQQMVSSVRATTDDTFIDLGSGVGQVVLQMAGTMPLKACIGIEKADTPAHYADRMDHYFRQIMAWFGKRYTEYRLLKGDFLVDEHREKITSSSLVFVNNFAFGPTVDHHLKERFADLRDGARVVSSKSFCPLNFRITDRNLSDIGTIMDVREIAPLKGSVSWTCKPVSYYMHTIDRTILERYFQRMKTQKGAETENVGTTRTTRDRAKREANNNNNNNNNNNSNGLSNSQSSRTFSPAAISNQSANSKSASKQQQQRNVDMDTSTESDGENNGGNDNNTANGAVLNGTGGRTTRKVWSDYCSRSSKGKSSQSDDEEMNSGTTNTTATRNARTATQKKRKKLTRKAAIASKSAAAAQREAAAREREAALQAAHSKDNSAKEDGYSGTSAGGGGAKGRKGRMKKGGRGRKNVNFAGLDVLHQRTLLSTSIEQMSKKLPTAPGCVDQKLTALAGDMSHNELGIPEAPSNTPYALQILLNLYRSQYMQIMNHMKSPSFVPNVRQQIHLEQERKQRIRNRVSQLDKQIKVLIDDSVDLLKVRMQELGINSTTPSHLIARAKEIVGRHKELQNAAKKMQSQVTVCEMEQKRMLNKHMQQLPEYQKQYGDVKPRPDMPTNYHINDISESAAHDMLVKEIANTLSQRKKLKVHINSIEMESAALEKTSEEKRTAAVLLAQGTNMTLTNVAVNVAPVNMSHSMTSATIMPATSLQQPLQLTTTPSTNTNSATVPNNVLPPTKTGSGSAKSSRRSRDHRMRSQEWPDVPDVGKIEESNPEVLAQKIMETARQIEARKLTEANHSGTGVGKQAQNFSLNHNIINHIHAEEPKRAHKYSHSGAISSSSEVSIYMGPHGPQDSTLMPAPLTAKNQLNMPVNAPPNNVMRSSILPKCELPSNRRVNTANSSNIQESPKVANFEDRLKSIITSALNEDSEQRKAVASNQLPNPPTGKAQTQSPLQSPVSKRIKQHNAATAVTLTGPPPQVPPHNLNNIITVATQGPTHLNATTTISPITPPLPPATSASHYGNYVAHSVSKYTSKQQQLLTSSSPTASKHTAKDNSNKYQHHSPALLQHHMQQMPHGIYGIANNGEMALQHQRRRNSISAANYEQFAAAQQLLAAAAAQQQHQQQQQQHAHHASSGGVNHHHSANMLPLEFKAPPATAENLVVATQRCSSREQLEDLPRSSSANSDSAVMYYPPTRDRLLTLERSSSRDSAASLPAQQQQPQQLPPSRPSSNSSQPDYTQVSPAKMALRRHLSQEKLNQQLQPTNASSMPVSSKTIGDLLVGEIERTLDLQISHQSIINAVVTKSAGAAPPVTEQRTNYTSNDSANERLLINPNVARPERVNVRPLDDQAANRNMAAHAERKTPIEHNMATLTHAATYNHKSMPNSNIHPHTARNYNTTREGNAAHYVPLPNAGSARQTTNAVRNAREFQNVPLPRAEMKGCIEAYFNEEQQHQQQHQHQQQAQNAQQAQAQAQLQKSSTSKERVGGGRGGRMNGGNPPLEGLAASLQDHVMASRKFKEENEERQRRAAVAAAVAAHNDQAAPAQHYSFQNQPHALSYYQQMTPQMQIKADRTLKRTSPITNACSQPPQAKIPLYELQQHQSTTHKHQMLATTNASNPYANTNGGIKISRSPPPTAASLRRNKVPIEPMLMSPEINTIMGDERTLQLSLRQQRQSTNATPTGAARPGADDDDVIADDETHWQHRVSSGFDRLVAFASTELDKTRRSIDTDIVPSSISCNTSPDSGITHSSSNSDVARTFLSTSSTSSQMEMPIGSGSSSSTSSSGYLHHHHHHHTSSQHSVDQLSDSSMKSSQSDAILLPISLKTSSPVDPSAIESPPLSDIGMPRTPSPNAAVATPPLAAAALANAHDSVPKTGISDVMVSGGGSALSIPLKYQRKSKSVSQKHYKKKFCERNWEYDCDDLLTSYQHVAADAAGTTATSDALLENSVQPPALTLLKTCKSPREIFEEKIADLSVAGGMLHHNHLPLTTLPGAGATTNHYHHHKSSKFRPKGKDWDWSMDSNSNSNKSKTEVGSAPTTANVA